ncbi:hypothetical protein HHI36_001882, partial [Cryptolaemus montrouzieri]
SETWLGLKTSAENRVETIEEWFDYNLLTMNVNKTNYVAFSCTTVNRPDYDELEIIEALRGYPPIQ